MLVVHAANQKLHAQEVSSAVRRIETERLQQRSEKALTAMDHADDEKERDERDEKSKALLAEKEAAAKVLAVRFSRSQQVFANQVTRRPTSVLSFALCSLVSTTRHERA